MSTIIKCGSPYIVETNKASVIFGSRGHKSVVIHPLKRNSNYFINAPDCLKGGKGMNGFTIIPSFYIVMCFSNELIQKVWEKAIPVMNQDPAYVQKDACGAWIEFEAYGDRNNEFGWEIDHIIPIAKGGTDDLSNLQPLQWDNNVAKGDGGLVRKVTADGYHNKIVPHWDILFE